VSVCHTPQFCSIYAYTLCRRTTKFDVWGSGVHLGVSHASHSKRAEFQRSQILEVLLYLCLHPLAQKDQIWHGNTYGEGRVFRSIIPLHLHKCVARFVSDS